MLGERFEAEIYEQPAALRRVAGSALAERFAAALGRDGILFVGSGSSLYVGMLAALAFRRRGVPAAALAATEATFERAVFRDATVVALSQSGRSADVLAAVELLQPRRLVALTNSGASPLAARADLVIDVAAGVERAIPATKSVTTMAAVVLWGAALCSQRSRDGGGGGGERPGGAESGGERSAATLAAAADALQTWFADAPAMARLARAAERLARRRSVAVVGAGYGVPVALEIALKLKESTYLHAEGFAAGEFRHGSVAMLDAATALVGVVDAASRAIVARPLAEAERSETYRVTIGEALPEIDSLGPPLAEPFNTLGWLATGQLLALHVGRARGIDGDAPRGLQKFVS